MGVTTLNPDEEMVLSPDFTFDQFIVGPNNQLAHAAANAVARKPGRAYNPFFIYGGHGLGKTHLLQAICQQAMQLHNPMRIYYISCDGFMTQFMEAVQEGQMREFRHRFRNVDMLVIDDIHDLSKRGQTQEEFFHTFNALYQAGKQLVLSSDAPPDQIPDLEERLSSRFNSGLVASMLKPSFETRVAILKSKAKLQGLALSDDVASYMAARIDTSIRDLQGRLNSLQHLASISSRTIDLELAKEVLEEFSSARSEQRDPPIHQIMDEISRYYGVKLSDLLSKRRQKSIAGPRQVGMWLARQHTRHSLEEIGSYFGGRDHTTVMHAIRSIESRQAEDPSLRHDVNQLLSRLRTEPAEHSEASSR
ncbi:MAG: chromosomal replication initiator protein DnaA [Phycisphaerales bacterium]|nr:MAG: chromosomal replication initiator protein DnaA [Phycisphaerales bacterium]